MFPCDGFIIAYPAGGFHRLGLHFGAVAYVFERLGVACQGGPSAFFVLAMQAGPHPILRIRSPSRRYGNQFLSRFLKPIERPTAFRRPAFHGRSHTAGSGNSRRVEQRVQGPRGSWSIQVKLGPIQGEPLVAALRAAKSTFNTIKTEIDFRARGPRRVFLALDMEIRAFHRQPYRNISLYCRFFIAKWARM